MVPETDPHGRNMDQAARQRVTSYRDTLPVDRMTDMCKNTTFSELHLQAAIKHLFLPHANEVVGRLCFQSCLSLILSRGGGSRVTITHHALDLTVQRSLPWTSDLGPLPTGETTGGGH